MVLERIILCHSTCWVRLMKRITFELRYEFWTKSHLTMWRNKVSGLYIYILYVCVCALSWYYSVIRNICIRYMRQILLHIIYEQQLYIVVLYFPKNKNYYTIYKKFDMIFPYNYFYESIISGEHFWSSRIRFKYSHILGYLIIPCLFFFIWFCFFFFSYGKLRDGLMQQKMDGVLKSLCLFQILKMEPKVLLWMMCSRLKSRSGPSLKQLLNRVYDAMVPDKQHVNLFCFVCNNLTRGRLKSEISWKKLRRLSVCAEAMRD